MKISVITTLYNYADYIEDAVKSFLNQDFDESEMVIVDDCSTDDSVNRIKKFESDRVRIICLPQNKGYSSAKNTGIKQSRSEIIAMLDADDMLTTNSLSVRYNKIINGFDMVHGYAMNLKNGKMSESSLRQMWLKSNKYKNVHAQTVMLKKDIHRKIGLYDENLRSKSDREMWARIFNHGFKIGYVDSAVSIYRLHSKQMHRSKEKLEINDKLQKNVLELIEKRKNNLFGLEKLT